MNASAAANAPGGPPPGHPSAKITVTVHPDNRLAVEGPMDCKAWMTMHMNAAIAVLMPYRRFKITAAEADAGYLPKRAGLRDVEAARIVVSVLEDDAIVIEGPLGSREWVVACLENAIDAVRAYRKPGSGIVDTISDPRIAS